MEPWRALRLEALRESPNAFLQSPEEFLLLNEEQLRDRLAIDQNHFTVGAFAEADKLVGMVGAFRETRPKVSHKANVWGTYLLPDYRRHGGGLKMMHFLLDHLHLIPGISQVQLSVASSQKDAKKLYESLGFIAFGEEKEAILVNGVLLDEFHMQKFLPTSPKSNDALTF